LPPAAHETRKSKPPCGCPCSIHGPRRLATAAPLSAVACHRLAQPACWRVWAARSGGSLPPAAHETRKSKPPCDGPCSTHGPRRLATAAPLSAVARHRPAQPACWRVWAAWSGGSLPPAAHETRKSKPPCDCPFSIHGPRRLATAAPLSAVASHRLAQPACWRVWAARSGGSLPPAAHETRKSKPPCDCPYSIHGPRRLATAAPLSAVACHRLAQPACWRVRAWWRAAASP